MLGTAVLVRWVDDGSRRTGTGRHTVSLTSIVGIALAAVGIAALLCWGVVAFAVGRVRAGPIRPDEVDRGDG